MANIEAPNTLQSNSRYRMLDALCEAPVWKFVEKSGVHGTNPLVSTYYDNVSVINPDGSSNYNTSGQGFSFSYRLGTGWDVISGFEKVETPVLLPGNTRVSNPPTGAGSKKDVVVSINTDLYPDADCARVTVRVPALLTQSDEGDTNGYTITYAIDVSLNNGPFNQVATDTIVGKCVAPYLRDTIIVLPKTTPASVYYNWKIRVRRISTDILSIKTQNVLFVEAISVISNNSFSYPNTVLVGTEITADQFGTVPTRAYEIYGTLVKIPNGYTPTQYNLDGSITKSSYPTIWDGTWATDKVWTDNPAWVFYDLITNKRYGLGSYIQENLVDKWTLYSIAQYCDEMVDDGEGGLEPRFTCNVSIQTRQDAYQLLQNMISVFQGMMYWYDNKIITVQSRDTSPVQNFTNANVIDGRFTYSDTARNTRSTVIKVKWTNPDNYYKETVEIVEDIDGIARYGYVEKEITAFACTSRAQAIRAANWVLLTERYMTETITFQAGLEGVYTSPGDIFSVYDNYRKNSQQGGRVMSYNGARSSITLDREIYLRPGYTYQLSATVSNANLDPSQLTGSDQIGLIRNPLVETRNVTTSTGYATILSVDSGFSTGLQLGATWILSAIGTDNVLSFAQKYRCLATSEIRDGVVEVLGVEWNPGINYRVDTGYNILPLPNNSGDNSSIYAPTNLNTSLVTGAYVDNSMYVYLQSTWTDSISTNKSYYEISGKKDNGAWELLGTNTRPEFSQNIFSSGTYNYSIRAVSFGGVFSSPLTGAYTVSSNNPFGQPPSLSRLYVVDDADTRLGYTGYFGNNVTIGWEIPTGFRGYNVPSANYISGYRVHFQDPATSSDLITPIVLTGAETKTYSLSWSQINSFVGGAKRSFKAYIETYDIDNVYRSGVSAVLNNPACTSGINSSFFGITGALNYTINETDFDTVDISGVNFWFNSSNSFSPTFANISAQSKQLAGIVNTNITGSYYTWYSLIDTFGQSGSSIIGPIPVTGNIITGPAGVNAKLVTLTSDSQMFKVTSGTPSPSVINFTATQQNLTGSPTFSVSAGSATLNGSGNTRQLTYANLSTDAATIKVDWDGQSDYLSVVKLYDGANGTSAPTIILSNENHTCPADSSGGSVDLTGASTYVWYYYGTTQIIPGPSTVSISTSSGVTASIGGTYNDLITVTSFTVDSGYIDITFSPSGYPALTKRMTLSKSKSGVSGNYVKRIYQRNYTTPTTPSASDVSPAGWTTDVPAGTDAVWFTEATINAAGTTVIVAWFTPRRLSGNINFYQGTQPSPSTYALMEGDMWWDTSNNYKLYRYTSSSWSAAFTPFLSLDGSNHITGVATAGNPSLPYVILTNAFQVWNGSSSEAPFEIIGGKVYINTGYVRELTFGRIVGGTATAQELILADSGGTHGMLRSQNYVSGSAGVILRGDGYFECNNGLFRGALDVGTSYNRVRIDSSQLTYGYGATNRVELGYDGIDAISYVNIYRSNNLAVQLAGLQTDFGQREGYLNLDGQTMNIYLGTNGSYWDSKSNDIASQFNVYSKGTNTNARSTVFFTNSDNGGGAGTIRNRGFISVNSTNVTLFGGSNSQNSQMQIGTTSNNDLAFGTYDNVRLTIKNDGTIRAHNSLKTEDTLISSGLQIIGSTISTSYKSLELAYITSLDSATIVSYDRPNSSFKPLLIQGSVINLGYSDASHRVNFVAGAGASAPSNPDSPAAWLDVQSNGTAYKIALYQ